MDEASQELARSIPEGESKSFRARAEHSGVARTTLQHRARGRPSKEEKDAGQGYLYPWEENALVRLMVQQDALGRPIRMKHLRSIAFSLASQRPPADRPDNPPYRNWPQNFYERRPELRASKSSALDWNRYDIYNKVVQWFEVIGKVLADPAVRPENVYNMDETGTMLSKPNSVKVLVGKDNKRGYRGARVKRTTITAIECVSAVGRYLNPMIIWPASTHRANRVTYPTPGWHYTYTDSGYTDTYISLQWLKLVFDPQTKEQANQRPRVLINDGFGTHEKLEVLEFCFENNIILCRLPSHTSHKLQPCDISVFSSLKSAYRDQVERLERGCVGKIGMEHFTYLYSPARDQAFTSRNIRAGWAKAGLFPFNLDKVLSDIPKPLPELNAPRTIEVRVGPCPHDQVPQTPVTPVSVEALTSLLDMIKYVPDDETNRQHKERLHQKHIKATQLSFAQRTLLEEHNRFLAQINNEAKPRRSTKSEVPGTARVMSYEDLIKAKIERAAKETAKETKKAEKAVKKATKEADNAEKEAKKAADEAEQAMTGKRRGRKRKRTAEVDASEPQAKVRRMSEVSEPVGFQMGWWSEEQEQIAPVARMI